MHLAIIIVKQKCLITYFVLRDSKMKGGLVGMTLNKGAVHRWLMSQAERSAIT